MPKRLCRLFSGFLLVTYVSLAGWMHVWALEPGLPKKGEETEHHQVCTWIGTSGEAGLATASLLAPPRITPTFSDLFPSTEVVQQTPTSPRQARAPPLPSF